MWRHLPARAQSAVLLQLRQREPQLRAVQLPQPTVVLVRRQQKLRRRQLKRRRQRPLLRVQREQPRQVCHRQPCRLLARLLPLLLWLLSLLRLMCLLPRLRARGRREAMLLHPQRCPRWLRQRSHNPRHHLLWRSGKLFGNGWAAGAAEPEAH